MNFYRGKDTAQDHMFVKCHNCQYFSSVRNYIKTHHPSHYHDYQMHTYKDPTARKRRVIEPTSIRLERQANAAPVSTNLKDYSCIPVAISPDPVKNYLRGRGIGRSMWNKFWYSPNFKITSAVFDTTRAEAMPDGDRLVIPFKDIDGKVMGVQGRDLTGKSSRKYIIIKDPDWEEKMYGLEGLDPSKTHYVCEGGIDSMFLDNAISTNDLNLTRYVHENAVYVPDNQYNHPDVIRQCDKIVDQKCSIVLFPRDIVGKDINEMVMNGHDVKQIVVDHTYKGLGAKLMLSKLRGSR